MKAWLACAVLIAAVLAAMACGTAERRALGPETTTQASSGAETATGAAATSGSAESADGGAPAP